MGVLVVVHEDVGILCDVRWRISLPLVVWLLMRSDKVINQQTPVIQKQTRPKVFPLSQRVSTAYVEHVPTTQKQEGQEGHSE